MVCLIVELFAEYLWWPGSIPGGIGILGIAIGLLTGFNQMVGLFFEFIETGLAFVEAVPPGIVRCHHHGAHPGSATFVVPQFAEPGWAP